MQISADRIIFDKDDFLAGFAPFQQNNSIRTYGRGGSFMRDFDPHSVIPGMAYPGKTGVDVTNVTGSLPSAVQVGAITGWGNQYAYSIGLTKANRLDITNNTLSNSGDWPHTIPDAGHGGHANPTFLLGALAVYNVAGVKKLFWSWNDDTDWDVGMYDLASTFNDDFMSTTPANPLAGTDLTDGQGLPHHLFVASDDLMYIGSNRYVHIYDGATGAAGTFSAKVLTLPVGFTVQGFAENNFTVAVFGSTSGGTGRRAEAKAFFYQLPTDAAVDPYKVVNLNDDEVACPFSFSGSLGCFTRNRNNGRSALRFFNGTEFKPVFFWTGGLPTLGGVEIWNDLVVWNTDGQIYAWGKRDGMFPQGAFQLQRGTGTTSGFVRSFISGNLYGSSGTGTSGGLQLFSNFSDNANFQSLTAYPSFAPDMHGRVRQVRVTFATTTTSASARALSVQLKTDGDQTTTTVLNAVTDVTVSNMLRVVRFDASNNSLPEFESMKINLIWAAGNGATDAPGIEKVEVVYDQVNTTTI